MEVGMQNAATAGNIQGALGDILKNARFRQLANQAVQNVNSQQRADIARQNASPTRQMSPQMNDPHLAPFEQGGNMSGAAQNGRVSQGDTDAAGYKAKAENLEDIYKSFEEPEEDRLKREKREKRELTLASISDGLQAFNGAFNAARGKTVVPDPTGSASEKVMSRHERQAKERRDAQKEKIANHLRMLQLQRLADQDAQNEEYRRDMLQLRNDQLERQKKKDAAADQLAKEKLEVQKMLREDKLHTDAEKSSYWDYYWYCRETLGYEDAQARSAAARYSFERRETENKQADRQAEAKATKDEKTGEAAIIRANKAGTKSGKKSPTGGSGTKSKKKSPTA